MGKIFSSNFWLDKSHKKHNSTFNDPLENAFHTKFGIDAFTYVTNLINDCEFSPREAHDDLQIQMDIIWQDMRSQNGEWAKCCFNPFQDSSSGESSPFGSPWERTSEGCPLT